MIREHSPNQRPGPGTVHGIGHSDFVRVLTTRVNVCYRLVNQWDLEPHRLRDLARGTLFAGPFQVGMATIDCSRPAAFGMESPGAIAGKTR